MDFGDLLFLIASVAYIAECVVTRNLKLLKLIYFFTIVGAILFNAIDIVVGLLNG